MRRRWWALVLLCLAQFMVILDATVVNVALPVIGEQLALSRATATWVVAGYTLCFGGLMLLGGRLAGALGRRRTFLIGLSVFTAASLVSGLAASAEILISERAAQGAALLSPAALSLITTAFHGRDRHRALGSATITALTPVDPHDAGVASGTINTSHELGASLGVAMVSTIAGRERFPQRLPGLVRRRARDSRGDRDTAATSPPRPHHGALIGAST
ncbi:MFS transporter [Allorhizocola rhizosphaerae]|uniref:MFS transporter n=1 Tax=Allorhizocola rhizosphaerae TaxID=1872709 RepID=UPI001FE4523E|nr:MFS transporter [Allorhizocola rhizosphaerae]